MAYKQKKVKKYRGSKTHGGGSMKKRRGAGHRGGRGNAGSGKRGDAKKPSYWSEVRKRASKVGFTSKNRKKVNAITVFSLDQRINKLVDKKLATVSGGVYTVDLRKAGFHKLLGTGSTTKKMNIKVDSATEKAVNKIQASKGTVEVLTVKE